MPMNAMSAEWVAGQDHPAVDDYPAARLAKWEAARRSADILPLRCGRLKPSADFRSRSARLSRMRPLGLSAGSAPTLCGGRKGLWAALQPQAFVEWLGRFYADHRAFIQQAMFPAFLALAEALWVRPRGSWDGLNRGALDTFVDRYAT